MKLLLLTLLISCGSHKARSIPAPEPSVGDLVAEWERVAKELLNEQIWLVDDCDAMLWQGKYAATTGIGDPRSAAHWSEEGHLGRRSSSPCWYEDREVNESASTWSRDMGLGLMYWAWHQKDLDILVKHRDYCRSRGWRCGDPLAGGRTVYLSNSIATLHKIIFLLGGEDNDWRRVPIVLSPGLEDYHAHLMAMTIHLHGLMDGEVSEYRLGLIEEQIERQPWAAYYQAVYAQYTGVVSPAVEACKNWKDPDYLRCGEGNCRLAEQIHACSMIVGM